MRRVITSKLEHIEAWWHRTLLCCAQDIFIYMDIFLEAVLTCYICREKVDVRTTPTSIKYTFVGLNICVQHGKKTIFEQIK